MLKKLLIIYSLFNLLFIQSSLASTWGKVAGKVIDKSTGKTIANASIEIIGTELGAFTDSEGNYFIINIPVGARNIKATMIGYSSITKTNVYISADLTTTVNFEMEESTIEGNDIIVIAKTEVIDKSNTSSRRLVTSEQIETLPVSSIQDALSIQPGSIAQGSAQLLHIRGGRSGEVVYMIDGMMVRDPMTGTIGSPIPQLGTEESSMFTGGFGAEYGNAQSGIVNVITKDGGENYRGKIQYETLIYKMPEFKDKLHLIMFSAGGPEPITKYLLKIPGKIRWSLAGDITPKSNGRFKGEHKKEYTIHSKFSYTPSANYRISFGALLTKSNYGTFSNLYSKTTDEDNLEEFKDTTSIYYKLGWTNNGNLDSEDGWIPDTTTSSGYRFDPSYKNGKMDYIDKNKNGRWDYGETQIEDINRNGKIDGEDLNRDGKLSKLDLTDNLWQVQNKSRQLILTWTHNLTKSTLYELRVSQYSTKQRVNLNEKINEDVNMNGKLDMGEDLNHNYILDPGEDIDGDGILDLSEKNIKGIDIGGYYSGYDVNGNGQLDPNEDINGNGKLDNGNEDIYVDEDNDGYIDGSDKRMRWEDIISTVRHKDSDGFFKYGSPFAYYPTYPTNQWRDSEKTTTSARIDITSQITKRHQVKFGGEGHYYSIYEYNINSTGIRQGGGVNYGEIFTIYPNSGGFYIQDKMEFQGMMANIGIRYDYFNANYKNYPKDIHDPIEDIIGGNVIKNPQVVSFRGYWNPRLGISYPIMENGLLRFSYGRYFQIPQFEYAFRNLNFSVKDVLVGNPNIEPERTSGYEVGLDYKIATNVLISIAGFYKDISGLVDTKRIYYGDNDWFVLFVNKDYGNVRGFEISLSKSPYNHWNFTLNYTFSVAKGKSSDAFQGLNAIFNRDIEPDGESYLNWDQRHTINFAIGLFSSDKKIFDIPFSDRWSLSLLLSYGSGMPWSLPKRNNELILNTERLPYTMQADLKIIKKFHYEHLSPLAYIEVDNLFNNVNIVEVDDDKWYYEYNDPSGQYKNPSVYGPRRTARAGVGVEF